MAPRKPRHWIEKALEGVADAEQPRDSDYDHPPGRKRPELAIRRIDRGRRKRRRDPPKSGPESLNEITGLLMFDTVAKLRIRPQDELRGTATASLPRVLVSH
jgi:hypothetical protein